MENRTKGHDMARNWPIVTEARSSRGYGDTGATAHHPPSVRYPSKREAFGEGLPAETRLKACLEITARADKVPAWTKAKIGWDFGALQLSDFI